MNTSMTPYSVLNGYPKCRWLQNTLGASLSLAPSGTGRRYPNVSHTSWHLPKSAV